MSESLNFKDKSFAVYGLGITGNSVVNFLSKNKAYKIYREIIEDKNKFYSILSLNTVLEKNLEPNKEIILSYFRILEKMSISKDQKDILILKKSLYFMDQSNKVEGEKLLKSLINSNSTLKSIAEEILNK